MIINPVVEALIALGQVDQAIDPERDPEEQELTDFQIAALNGLRGIGYAMLAIASGGESIKMEENAAASLENMAKSVFPRR